MIRSRDEFSTQVLDNVNSLLIKVAMVKDLTPLVSLHPRVLVVQALVRVCNRHQVCHQSQVAFEWCFRYHLPYFSNFDLCSILA